MSKYESLQKWQQQRDLSASERIESKKYVKKLTPNHLAYMKSIEENELIICVGPAGTGKTSLACQVGAKLIKENKIKRIVITRPLVECGSRLGTLPGGVEEKMSLFISPMMKALESALGEKLFISMKEAGLIEIMPLEQMRGATFDDALVIIDEPQNASFEQLHMALTRLGHGSKIVMCGDLYQSDLHKRREDVPLLKTALTLKEINYPTIKIFVFRESDVLRPNIVSVIDKAMRAAKSDNISYDKDNELICEVPSYRKRKIKNARSN